MAEEEKQTPTEPSPPTPPEYSPQPDDQPPKTSIHPTKFNPSRMVGIIKRKALIKDLAAAYHTECLAYCRELLELQKKKDEPFLHTKAPEDPRKEMSRPSSKRAKKKR